MFFRYDPGTSVDMLKVPDILAHEVRFFVARCGFVATQVFSKGGAIETEHRGQTKVLRQSSKRRPPQTPPPPPHTSFSPKHFCTKGLQSCHQLTSTSPSHYAVAGRPRTTLDLVVLGFDRDDDARRVFFLPQQKVEAEAFPPQQNKPSVRLASSQQAVRARGWHRFFFLLFIIHTASQPSTS